MGDPKKLLFPAYNEIATQTLEDKVARLVRIIYRNNHSCSCEVGSSINVKPYSEHVVQRSW